MNLQNHRGITRCQRSDFLDVQHYTCSITMGNQQLDQGRFTSSQQQISENLMKKMAWTQSRVQFYASCSPHVYCTSNYYIQTHTYINIRKIKCMYIHVLTHWQFTHIYVTCTLVVIVVVPIILPKHAIWCPLWHGRTSLSFCRGEVWQIWWAWKGTNWKTMVHSGWRYLTKI